MPWWAMGLAAAAPYHADVPLPSLDYRTLTTEHFAIHFVVEDRRGRPVNARPYAEALARGADDLLLDMVHALGARRPRGRIHVLVLDRQDEVEGYTLPHWDWIVLSAHPGSQLARTRGRSDGAMDALAHELGHLLTHKQASALPEALNYGLTVGGTAEGAAGGVGLALEVDHDRPYGWSEGMAEFASQLAGVNHWTTERGARLRAAAREGRLLTWDELQLSVDKDPGDHERAYQQGYAFARWLDERQPGVWRRLAVARSERGWPSWRRLLREVVGEEVRELHRQFLDHLRAEAATADEAVRARGIAEGEELLTWRPLWRRQKRWAEDAWAERPPREREESREGTGTWRLCPSHDGQWLLEGRVGWVVATARDEAWLPGIAPWPEGTDPRGKGRSVWIPARYGRSFAAVPGEEAVVVIAPMNATRPGAIIDGFDLDQAWQVQLPPPYEPPPKDAARDVRRRMQAIPGTERAVDLAVSPDGTTLAFLRFVGGGQELVVGPLDGSAWRVVDRWGTEAHAQGLSWSPGGTELASSVLRGGMVDLWTIEVATAEWTARTRDRWHEQDPHWTTEGIWFSADLDGTQDVFLLADDEVVRVTSERDGAICPSVTPSGHLLYSRPASSGIKAMGLARSQMHGALVTGRFELDPAPQRVAAALDHVPPPLSIDETVYRPWRSLLPPSWGPFVRVDLSGPEVSPAAGALGTLGDAVERHELTWWTLVGDDVAGELQYSAHTLWPVVGGWGRGALARRRVPESAGDRRSLWDAGLFASRRLTDQVEVELQAQAFRLDRAPDAADAEALSGQRGVASVTLGDRPSTLDAEGIDLELGLTIGRSRHEVGADRGWVDQGELLTESTWARPWARGSLHAAIGPRGRLDDAPHRLEVRGAAGHTTRGVALEEELAAGGETPGALRLTAVEPSWSLPGLAPYQLHGESLAVGGVAWAWPVAPRWRTVAGAWALRRIELVAGGDLGASWSWRDGQAPAWTNARLAADGRLAIRLASRFRDARFDSQLLVAWPLLADGLRAPRRGEVPAASTWGEAGQRAPRFLLGLGTGW